MQRPSIAMICAGVCASLSSTLACSESGRPDTSIFGASAGPISDEGTSSDDSSDGGESSEDPEASFDVGPGDEEPTDEGCAETTVMATTVPPNVVLVLDYSSSMTQSIGGFFSDSRWAVLWDSVNYATTNYDEHINFGAVLFPDMAVQTNNSCETQIVEVPVAPLNGAAVMSTLPPREHSPPGNTPTRAGLSVAAGHLDGLDPEIPQALILVTDGEALCKEGEWAELSDDTVAAYVGSLAAQGVPTHVIGMSNLGQSAQDQLNDMAQQSGVPNPNGPQQYYSADDLVQLQAAFDSVAGDVISCSIELEFSPPNPDYLLVEVDGAEVPHVDSCQGMDGWTFVPDTDNLWIELCGSACVDFQQNGTVHVVQACPPQG